MRKPLNKTKMKQYEYLILEGWKTVEDLNKLGLEGWLLISHTGRHEMNSTLNYVFVREIPSVKKSDFIGKDLSKKSKSLRVGDYVTVLNDGGNYPNYTEKRVEMGFKTGNTSFRPLDYLPSDKFKIFSIGKHDDSNKSLYGIIGKDGIEYLFASYSLKKVE